MKRAGQGKSVVESASSGGFVSSLRPDAEVVTLRGPHLVPQAAPREAAAALTAFCERLRMPTSAG